MESYNLTLEEKVEERTAKLNHSLNELEIAKQNVMDSIEYSKMIQRSLLPNRE